VAALEARVTDVTAQLARALLAAETGHAAASQADLETRLAALEAWSQISAIDEARMVEALNSQKWFWAKLRVVADAAAEAALDEHTEAYDHDDYDAHVNDDDKHPEGDLEEKVREVIDGLEITLSL